MVTLLLNRSRPNSWTALETPNKLEETQASRRISVQRLLRVHTVNTSLLHHHQPSVVDVPGKGGHGLVLWVHNRILQDEHRVSNIDRKESPSPVGHPVRLGQESAGRELLVRGPSVHYVFRQDMFAIGIRALLPEGSEHLVPGAPEHALAQEILHHRPGRGGLSA